MILSTIRLLERVEWLRPLIVRISRREHQQSALAVTHKPPALGPTFVFLTSLGISRLMRVRGREWSGVAVPIGKPFRPLLAQSIVDALQERDDFADSEIPQHHGPQNQKYSEKYRERYDNKQQRFHHWKSSVIMGPVDPPGRIACAQGAARRDWLRKGELCQDLACAD